MKKYKKYILCLLTGLIIIALSFTVPVLVFVSDFQSAILHKDYRKIEQYLNEISEIHTENGVVWLNTDVNDTDGGPYALYSIEREYTKPKLAAVRVDENLRLELFFHGTVTFDEVEGGFISYFVRIDWLRFGVKIVVYESG